MSLKKFFDLHYLFMGYKEFHLCLQYYGGINVESSKVYQTYMAAAQVHAEQQHSSAKSHCCYEVASVIHLENSHIINELCQFTEKVDGVYLQQIMEMTNFMQHLFLPSAILQQQKNTIASKLVYIICGIPSVFYDMWKAET
ncbi:hypothetical protein ACJX0J_019165 [Zea mays]